MNVQNTRWQRVLRYKAGRCVSTGTHGEKSKEKVVSSADLLLPPEWPLRISNFHGKGRGLIASRKIKKGEVILVEEPVTYTFTDGEHIP
jgi:hypothetical protein